MDLIWPFILRKSQKNRPKSARHKSKPITTGGPKRRVNKVEETNSTTKVTTINLFKFSRFNNGNLVLGLARVGALFLNSLDDLFTFQDLSKDSVTAVEPRSLQKRKRVSYQYSTIKIVNVWH